MIIEKTTTKRKVTKKKPDKRLIFKHKCNQNEIKCEFFTLISRLFILFAKMNSPSNGVNISNISPSAIAKTPEIAIDNLHKMKLSNIF